MDYVLRFEEINAADAGLVGEEGVNLAVLMLAGLPVPPGFWLSAGAYRAFTASAHVDKTIRQILAGLRVDDPEDVEVRTEQIRNFLCAQPVPVTIAQEVLESYYQLGVETGSCRAPIPVAVRSSSIAGSLHRPFGGELQDTFLNVCGEADLLDHVKRCWGSLWTVRTVTSRSSRGFDHTQVAVAVVVQAMVQAQVSGRLFGGKPTTNGSEEATITACWGAGQLIASGVLMADKFRVRKSDGAIVERDIVTKDRMIECAKEGGTVEREVPPHRRLIPSLSEEQIGQLVSLWEQIEKHFGAPMDIQWACARGRVYILQARASLRPG